MFDLIAYLSINNTDNKQLASESQSQGGASESYTYITKTDIEIAQYCDDIIKQYFYGGGIGELLYRGASI